MLTLSDTEYTEPQTTGATATFDLSQSSLLLPVVGAGVPAATTPPTVTATTATPDRRTAPGAAQVP